MSDEFDEVEGERPSVPSVNDDRASRNRKIIGGFIVVLAVAVFGLMYSSGGQEIGTDLDDENKEDFKNNTITKLIIPVAQTPTSVVDKEYEAPEYQMGDFVQIDPELEKIRQEQLVIKEMNDSMIKERRRKGKMVVYNSLAPRKVEPQTEVGNRQTMERPDAGAMIANAMSRMPGQERQPSRISKDDVAGRLGEGKTTKTISARPIYDREWKITQGAMIEAVLETAINTNLPAFLRAVVRSPVYSDKGDRVLIPAGSKLIGEYKAGINQGDTRIFVIWNRVITPNDIQIDLASPGTDQLGRGGLGGHVDHHFIRRFGASFLLSMIGGYAASDDDVSEAASNSFKDTAAIALESSINIPPTLYQNQGALVNVFVAHDIDFKNVLEMHR